MGWTATRGETVQSPGDQLSTEREHSALVTEDSCCFDGSHQIAFNKTKQTPQPPTHSRVNGGESQQGRRGLQPALRLQRERQVLRGGGRRLREPGRQPLWKLARELSAGKTAGLSRATYVRFLKI